MSRPTCWSVKAWLSWIGSYPASNVKMGNAVEGCACSSHEQICSAATRLRFSPGMMRRTRNGAVQLEHWRGTCTSHEEFQPAPMGCQWEWRDGWREEAGSGLGSASHQGQT